MEQQVVEDPSVITVLGPLKANQDIGPVLMNEHLVCEPSNKTRHCSTNRSKQLKMAYENLSEIRSKPFECADNVTLYSQHEVLNELQHLLDRFSKKPSSSSSSSKTTTPLTILDVTNAADGRDLKSSQTIARRLGIHVIVGTSCCRGINAVITNTDNNTNTNTTTSGKKEDVGDPMEEDIARMEQELLRGINADTNESKTMTTTTSAENIICAGFIGEVNISEAFTSSERQELRACAVVQGITKAPLIVAAPEQCLLSVIDQIKSSGGNLCQTVLSHMDLCAFRSRPKTQQQVEPLEQVLSRGVNISIDRFSLSSACFDFDGDFPTLMDAVNGISGLLQRNPAYVHQIVLSSGICTRLQYRKYGGPGYCVLFEELLPRLEQKGISGEQIHIMVYENPRRLLQWWTPPAKPEKPKQYLPCSVCKEMFEPIEGEYFTKYTFTYCGRNCLKKHVQLKFKSL